MAQPVPDSPINDNIRSRLDEIGEKFTAAFSSKAEIYSSVPGRVNLIGEHIDYCGYGVLPMAIEQTIVFAARKTDGKLKFVSTDHDLEPYEGQIANFNITSTAPIKWYNYALCGVRGIVDRFGADKTAKLGMECIVDGTVPRCAGLSSSSALVCSAAFAYLRISGLTASRLELADTCQHCERYIGTCGGGMDQAVALLAQPGSAQFIEFEPSLKATPVTLPPGFTFVVANSCVEKNKAASSDFNQRVLETRLAARLLAKALDVNETAWAGRPRPRLADIQHGSNSPRPGDMVMPVKSLLHAGPYSLDEVVEILNISREKLIENDFPANTRDVVEFWLRKRAEHVYSEAERVLAFRDACVNAEGKSPNEVAVQLGALMNASHDSCRFSYQCSHPQLDQLVSICRSAGALGSRLTGAGWGGCCVSLVRDSDVAAFLSKVSEQYYAVEETTAGKDPINNGWLFATRPAAGASCYIAN